MTYRCQRPEIQPFRRRHSSLLLLPLRHIRPLPHEAQLNRLVTELPRPLSGDVVGSNTHARPNEYGSHACRKKPGSLCASAAPRPFQYKPRHRQSWQAIRLGHFRTPTSFHPPKPRAASPCRRRPPTPSALRGSLFHSRSLLRLRGISKALWSLEPLERRLRSLSCGPRSFRPSPPLLPVAGR